MRISLLRVQSYKGARDVTIRPPADVYVLYLAGENGAGKTSTMDAMTVALGGAKQLAELPVTIGEQQSDILIELDGGKLTVHRTIEPDGGTQLVVSDEDGPIKRPQETLDKLIGARFLDPLKFIRLDAAEQRARLMKIIPNADEIAQLDARRERSYKQRTETGRHLEHARGELARLPKPGTPLQPIDAAALIAEHRKLSEQQRATDAIEHELASKEAKRATTARAAASKQERVEQLERELEVARLGLAELGDIARREDAEIHGIRARLEEANAAWVASAPRRADLERDIVRASEHNLKVGEQQAAARRHSETAAAVERHAAEVAKLSATIEQIDARKGEILAAAELPVAGLSIAGDGILIRGVPFAQAAAHEQMQVALSLAIATSPGLDDVWIRDGSLLGDKTIELIEQRARETGKRVWIERVGVDDPGAIVIRDGEVVDVLPPPYVEVTT